MSEITAEQLQTMKENLEAVGQSRASNSVGPRDLHRAFSLAGVRDFPLPLPPAPPRLRRAIVREGDVQEIHVEVTPDGYWRLGEEHSR